MSTPLLSEIPRGAGGGGRGPQKSLCARNFPATFNELLIRPCPNCELPRRVAFVTDRYLWSPTVPGKSCWHVPASLCGRVAPEGGVPKRLGMCTDRCFRVYATVWVCRKRLSTLLFHRRRENIFSVTESGTVLPLLTGAASAPWHASHAGPSTLHPRRWSLGLSTTGIGNVIQGQGFRIATSWSSSS